MWLVYVFIRGIFREFGIVELSSAFFDGTKYDRWQPHQNLNLHVFASGFLIALRSRLVGISYMCVLFEYTYAVNVDNILIMIVA